MTPRVRTALALALCAAAVALAGQLMWETAVADGVLGGSTTSAYRGSEEVPGLGALALVLLAAAVALTLVGQFGAFAVGCVAVMTGLSTVGIGWAYLFARQYSLPPGVEITTHPAGPVVVIVAGLVAAGTGGWLVRSFRRWPAASRRTERTTTAAVTKDSAQPDSLDETGAWDALSGGSDPT